MEVKFTKLFGKDIDRINNKSILIRVSNAIKSVENAKKINEIQNIKKLQGEKNCFRIRIGDYRIGLYIDNNIVEFVRLLPRKDIYKYFPDK